MPTFQRITPCLWFDRQAEDAAKFYTGIFKNSRILKTSRYTEAGREVHGRPPGSVMTVSFELQGQPMTERAFRPQLFQQLLGPIKRFGLDLAAFDDQAPTARHLLLG